ncbi:uncharacterized protein LOC134209398 [Armigeres subalbatus]|uniref:uncharacterized protein LOC134209398 n=1 Tax=Armigeres subalbatus TaxID=124917 RepID=UPI002ED07EE7
MQWTQQHEVRQVSNTLAIDTRTKDLIRYVIFSDMENEHPDIEIQMNIVDILDYVGESVRPIKEGYAVFAANHIVCIGYRNVQRSDMLTEVVGYVTQTSHPGCSPHEVLLLVGPDISRWILKCSYKAGTAKCKHVIACILFIEKNRLLEYISCTDVTQAWGISKAGRKATWGAKRVTDLCCVNKPKLLETPESNAELELLTTSFNRILNGNNKYNLSID